MSSLVEFKKSWAKTAFIRFYKLVSEILTKRWVYVKQTATKGRFSSLIQISTTSHIFVLSIEPKTPILPTDPKEWAQ